MLKPLSSVFIFYMHLIGLHLTCNIHFSQMFPPKSEHYRITVGIWLLFRGTEKELKRAAKLADFMTISTVRKIRWFGNKRPGRTATKGWQKNPPFMGFLTRSVCVSPVPSIFVCWLMLVNWLIPRKDDCVVLSVGMIMKTWVQYCTHVVKKRNPIEKEKVYNKAFNSHDFHRSGHFKPELPWYSSDSVSLQQQYSFSSVKVICLFSSIDHPT